jgi:hypothetical protein
VSGLVVLSWHHSAPFSRFELMLSQLFCYLLFFIFIISRIDHSMEFIHGAFSLFFSMQMWISKGEYDESGPAIVHRKCF